MSVVPLTVGSDWHRHCLLNPCTEVTKVMFPSTMKVCALTVNVSSGSCMVMQSMLIWMVFPADPSAWLSLKFSSIGWTVCMEDLKHKKRENICKLNKIFFVHLRSKIVLCVWTHWSSISNSWLTTSWLKKSVVCEDWFWDMAVRKELSLQDRQDGSLSLQEAKCNSHQWFLFQSHKDITCSFF